MPSHPVKGGWKWGSKGKVYPTKAQADRQGRAAYAAGYRPGATKAAAAPGRAVSATKKATAARKATPVRTRTRTRRGYRDTR